MLPAAALPATLTFPLPTAPVLRQGDKNIETVGRGQISNIQAH